MDDPVHGDSINLRFVVAAFVERVQKAALTSLPSSLD
jgi:hypothetical protein